MDRLADNTDQAGRAAIRAVFALKRLKAELRKIFTSANLAAAGMVVFRAALAGAGLVALGMASLALPALAIALYNVAAAALVVTAAVAGGLLGALGAAVLMGVAVVDRFKQMSGVIGSAANRLADAGYLIRGAFRDSTAEGADALMRGLARGLVKLDPLIRGLEGSFTATGQAFGSMFDRLFGVIATMGPELRSMFRELIPVIQSTGTMLGSMLRLFVQVATVGAPLVADAFDWMAAKMSQWTEGFTAGKVDVALGTLKSFAAGVRAFWSAFAAPIKPFFGDAMAEFGAAWKTLGPAIGTVLGTIVAGLMQVGRVALPYVTKAFEWLAAKAPGALAWLGKAASSVYNDVLKPLGPFLSNILWPLIKGIAKSLATGLGFAFKIIGWVAQALGWVGEKAEPLKGFFEVLGQVIGFVFGPQIIGAIGKVLSGIGSVGRSGGVVFKFLGNIIGGLARAIGWVARGIGWLGGQVFRGLGAVLKWVWTRMSGVQRFIASLAGGITAAATAFWGGFREAAKSVFEWVKGALDDIVDWIKKLPSRFLGAIGSIPGIGGALGALGIKGHAGGGTITSPGLSWVGERGPELVRLPKAATVYTSAESRRIAAHDRPQRQTRSAARRPQAAQINWTLVLPSMREIARGVKEINLADVALEG